MALYEIELAAVGRAPEVRLGETAYALGTIVVIDGRQWLVERSAKPTNKGASRRYVLVRVEDSTASARFVAVPHTRGRPFYPGEQAPTERR